MITCIKDIKTKKGLTFVKGGNYEAVFTHEGARVYVDKFNSVVIKNESIFNTYFK